MFSFVRQYQASSGRLMVLSVLRLLRPLGYTDHNRVGSAREHDDW